MRALGGRASAVGYRDILLGMNLMLSVVLGLVLASINPASQESVSVDPPGQMIITANWPTGAQDVDLWVTGPGEKKPVGYSNRGGTLFNLLRDDLGSSGDHLPFNYENAYSRGLPAGEYVINLQYYAGSGDVPVSVEVRFGPVGEKTALFFTGVVELTNRGQERTVIRFRLDDRGRIVPGSPNKVFKPLRSGK